MIRLITFFSIALLFSSQALAAACPDSSSTTTAGNGTCDVIGSQSTIQLNFNSGFDSTTAIAAIDGNNGTTLGAQRKLSFIKAAEIIADQVASPTIIVVDADFSALSCNASSATLGSAGATNNLGYPSSPPSGIIANTFYPIGLLNAIVGSDADNTMSDVTAQFNSNIGTTGCLQSSNGWYYGFAAPPANYIGFTTVLLHEITHGLGFSSLTNPSTGAKSSSIDDIFSNFLYSLADGADWSVAAGLSDGQRAASAVSNTGLLWTGTHTNTQAQGLLSDGFHDADSDGVFEAGDLIEMYAPNPVEGGSSVSHFNTDVSPNELMEPQYTEGQYTLGLAAYLLQDIGWSVSPISNDGTPILNPIGDQSGVIGGDVIVNLSASDSDGDTLTFSIASDTGSVASLSGSTLTLSKSITGTYSVTVQVSDGTDTDDETFNFTTYAEPSIDINGTTPSIGDSINIANTSTSIDTSAVNQAFTASLTLDGNNVNGLLSSGSNQITVGMPSSGQFAGEYVLTFTDSNTGETYSFTLVRDPRLAFSATKLLENQNIQTLDIEGGAVGTTYNLSSSESSLTFSADTVSASDDAASFNRARVSLNVSDIVSSTPVTITATSTYNPATSTGVTLEPSRTHVVTVKDEQGNLLSNATVTLDTTGLSAYNLAEIYVSDSSGQASLALPDDGNDYSIQVNLSGYRSSTATLVSGTLTQTVTLVEIQDPFNVSGSVTAVGTLDFSSELPVIALVLTDDNEINLTATQVSSKKVTFDYIHDLTDGNISSIQVTYAQEYELTHNLDTSNSSKVALNLFIGSSSTTSSTTTNIGSGGGSLGLWLALLVAIGLGRPLNRKTKR